MGLFWPTIVSIVSFIPPEKGGSNLAILLAFVGVVGAIMLYNDADPEIQEGQDIRISAIIYYIWVVVALSTIVWTNYSVPLSTLLISSIVYSLTLLYAAAVNFQWWLHTRKNST